jgi:hypothetical protein
MRKLAREAVIFMLLMPIVAFAGSFIYLYHDAHKSAAILGLPHGAVVVVPIPPVSPDPLDTLGTSANPPVFNPAAPYQSTKPPTPESDPYADIATPIGGTNTSIPPKSTSDLLGDSVVFGLYGFPLGLGLWMFYRVVRFAIKG